MSELVAFYEAQAKNAFSNIPWLLDIQQKALNDFMRLGFPNKHQEDWKYTSLTPFLKQSFAVDKSKSVVKLKSNIPFAAGKTIHFCNGQLVEETLAAIPLPKGVLVNSLTEACVQHQDKLQPFLNTLFPARDGVHALNTAMLDQGLFIYVPADVHLDEPIVISHSHDQSHQASFIRHVVMLEPGSRATVIEDYQGDDRIEYHTNTMTNVHLSASAHFTHYKIQREGQLGYHLGHLSAVLANGSQLDSHSFSVGGQLVRSDTSIQLQEPNASCSMNGIYAPTAKQHMDHHTEVIHNAPDCHSEQDYKGILNGQSRAVFNGRVIVAKGAHHTRAEQQNKNLLLSVGTEVDTKPQLEIFADDVLCTHGATVGQLDEEALFYLATRGIGRADASRYLVQAFVAENLKAITNKELAAWMGTLFNFATASLA